MKRLVWGAILFLFVAAGDGSRLLACNDRPMSRFHDGIFQSENNTVVVISDDEFVTVIVYANPETTGEWM